jgi:glyoxylase-like metal-dependent hydrolase (beta-lactamase superfamily II)
MTLDGTNTWVLREPGARRSVVVDPGPEILSHLDAVAGFSGEAGEVGVVLLTHGHLDHSEAARSFAERVGCGIRALDPAHRFGEEGLVDGDVVAVDGLEVHVVGTPGHTSDSLSFLVPADGAVLTGDTVLGRGTTVVAHPDGKLGAYLHSLHRLRDLAEAHEVAEIWPGHGPVVNDALATLDFYLAHRRQRLDQVRDAVRDLTHPAEEPPTPTPAPAEESPKRASGRPVAQDVTPHQDDLARRVVERVYVDVDPVLWGAAELSVRAQLDYLRDH